MSIPFLAFLSRWTFDIRFANCVQLETAWLINISNQHESPRGGEQIQCHYSQVLNRKWSNGATKEIVFLSGAASRIILPVPSKRQKFTVIELCLFDNLGQLKFTGKLSLNYFCPVTDKPDRDSLKQPLVQWLIENLAKCLLVVLGPVIFTQKLLFARTA